MRARGRFSLFLVALFGLVAAGADFLPYGPTTTRTDRGVEVLRPPSRRHWLGTDDRGRDVATRLAHGTRTSGLLAMGVLALAMGAGILGGSVAGALRGPIDAAVVAVCDLLCAVPGLLVVIAAQGLMGQASFAGIIGLIALPRAADVARLVRAEVRRALAAPHAEAARSLGVGGHRLVMRHALPLAAPQLAVAAAVTVSSAVLSEAALTFLGFGVAPPTASWGELLRQAHQNQLAWWLAAPAGASLALVALACNALADRWADAR